MIPAKIGAHTLPPISSYSITVEYIGGSVTLASGKIRRDLMASEPKRRISLAWVALDLMQLTGLETAYRAVVEGDMLFVGPDGMQCTVNAGPNPGLRKESYKTSLAGGVLLWRCSFELWEA